MSARRRTRRGARAALRHEIVTPEGIPLVFDVAHIGDRISAILMDLVIIGVGVAALALAALGVALVGLGDGWIGAFAVLCFFFLRSFYFIFFEVRWQGSTPGKRRYRLRVIDRSGGALRGDAIFVRNLMREVELFLPLAALSAPHLIWPGGGGLGWLLSALWLLVLLFWPIFNRLNLRVGDMVAGTIVVYQPQAVLLGDLSGEAPLDAAALRFTKEQLEIYGIYELQVLEELLRSDRPDAHNAYGIVAEKIQDKIGWPEGRRDVEPERVLRAFYAAQRGRLEASMLMGVRRERKRDADASEGPPR